MKKQKKTHGFVPPKGSGPFKLNQRADVFEHKATKRLRAKDVQKRTAVEESTQA